MTSICRYLVICGALALLLSSCSLVGPPDLQNLSLDHSSVTLTRGDTIQLTATYQPQDAKPPVLTWSTSDSTVATVSMLGLVTAVAVGTTNISAIDENSLCSDSCSVTVNGGDSSNVPPAGGDSDPWAGYDSYLSKAKYDSLIDVLSGSGNISKRLIDGVLDDLNVRQDYEYSLYTSGDYICHTLLWKKFSSYTYDWVYYVDVDVWTDAAGNLKEDMCSYYSG